MCRMTAFSRGATGRAICSCTHSPCSTGARSGRLFSFRSGHPWRRVPKAGPRARHRVRRRYCPKSRGQATQMVTSWGFALWQGSRPRQSGEGEKFGFACHCEFPPTGSGRPAVDETSLYRHGRPPGRARVAPKVRPRTSLVPAISRDTSPLRWLTAQGCSHVAMEPTGFYWKPMWNILSDGDFELLVANAAHIKNVPGRKHALGLGPRKGGQIGPRSRDGAPTQVNGSTIPIAERRTTLPPLQVACYRRGDETTVTASPRAGGARQAARSLSRLRAVDHALVAGGPGAHGAARRRRAGGGGVLA